jgi:hypothetical protein
MMSIFKNGVFEGAWLRIEVQSYMTHLTYTQSLSIWGCESFQAVP